MTKAAAGGSRWARRAVAMAFPIILLAGVEVGLRVFGAVPPADPRLLGQRTTQTGFSPFVEERPGVLAIHPDWVNDSDQLRGYRSEATGTVYLTPSFRPSRISVAKPERTIRVIVLGGSTAFGLYAPRGGAFPDLVGAGLRASWPTREVEVVNLAAPGWASGRVASLLRTTLPLDPDLILVLTGHNEMLDGGRSVEERIRDERGLHTALLGASVGYRWINRAVSGRSLETLAMAEEVAAIAAHESVVYDGLGMVGGGEPLPEPRMEQAAARFVENLNGMSAAAAAAGVPIVFAIPEANLLLSPFATEDAVEPGGAALDSVIAAAMVEADADRWDVAAEVLRTAPTIAPRSARAHYVLGLALLRSGEAAEGISELERAVELDPRPHRITARLQDAMARALARTGTPAVDLRPVFRTTLPAGGYEELFVDHVHPTGPGHRMIASALLGAVIPLLQPTLGPPAGGGDGSTAGTITSPASAVPRWPGPVSASRLVLTLATATRR